MKAHLRARFEALGPSFVAALESAVEGVKKLKCPFCAKCWEYKIPTATSIRAALGGLDRIGMGPTSTTVVRPGAPEGGDLQTLMDTLIDLPYGERCLIAKTILPEHLDLLGDIDLEPLLTAGDVPEDVTN